MEGHAGARSAVNTTSIGWYQRRAGLGKLGTGWAEHQRSQLGVAVLTQ
jgi:hypothetical protein